MFVTINKINLYISKTKHEKFVNINIIYNDFKIRKEKYDFIYCKLLFFESWLKESCKVRYF